MELEKEQPKNTTETHHQNRAENSDIDTPVFLTARCVRQLTGLSDSTIRRLRMGEDFPSPIRLTPSAAGHLRWYESEILDWLETRRRA